MDTNTRAAVDSGLCWLGILAAECSERGKFCFARWQAVPKILWLPYVELKLIRVQQSGHTEGPKLFEPSHGLLCRADNR